MSADTDRCGHRGQMAPHNWGSEQGTEGVGPRTADSRGDAHQHESLHRDRVIQKSVLCCRTITATRTSDFPWSSAVAEEREKTEPCWIRTHEESSSAKLFWHDPGQRGSQVFVGWHQEPLVSVIS